VRRTAQFLSLLALLVGCASAPDPGPDPALESEPTEGELAGDSASAAEDLVCRRNATVTVRVENRSSMDLKIGFGSYRPARVADGFSRTTYQIARYHLQGAIRLEVLRGGTQLGGPTTIQTEPVFCNNAALVIGSRPEYSIFYGDVILGPSDLLAADSAKAVADSTEAAADSARAEADSSSSGAGW